MSLGLNVQRFSGALKRPTTIVEVDAFLGERFGGQRGQQDRAGTALASSNQAEIAISEVQLISLVPKSRPGCCSKRDPLATHLDPHRTRRSPRRTRWPGSI